MSNLLGASHRRFSFLTVNRVPIARISSLDAVAVEWETIIERHAVEATLPRPLKQDNEIVCERKLDSLQDQPAFEILFCALLGMEADGVERTRIAEIESVWRSAGSCSAFSTHCPAH